MDLGFSSGLSIERLSSDADNVKAWEAVLRLAFGGATAPHDKPSARGPQTTFQTRKNPAVQGF